MLTFFKKLLPKNISSRFFLILLLPVVFSQVIFGVVFLGKHTETIFRVVSNQIAGDVKAISRMLDLKYEEKYIEEIKKNIDMEVDILNDTALKKNGLQKKTKAYRMLSNAFNRKNIKEYYIMPFEKKVLVYVASDDNKNVYKMSFSRKKMDIRIISIVLGWGGASAIVLLLIAFLFLKNQIRPITRLSKAMEQYGQGKDTNTFVPEGAKEVRMAGQAFCEMKINFRKLLSERMKTLAGISHDLRTPLTKMKLQLGMMSKTKETEWLLRDVNMMIKITESFTLHAAAQNKEMFVHRNLTSFMNEISLDYKSDDFNVFIVGDKAIEVSIKYVSLKRAFGNIISNSKKYAKNIYIDFERSKNMVNICFEDDGVGIDPEITESIFSPFVGQNDARTQSDTVSVGLGLSIARDAIIDHGGDISASQSKKYGGARFIVNLPLEV